MWHFIAIVLTGFFAGLVARALKPGDDRMGLLKTTLLGVFGSLLAGWFANMMGWYQTRVVLGFLASVVGAVIVLFAYQALLRARDHHKMIHH